MSSPALRLFLELFTAASFVAAGIWMRHRFGRDGLALYGFLVALGFVRENFVVLERLLYGYAELALAAGAAPLIGVVIWPFSIAAALAAAESIGGRPLGLLRPRARELALVALFMAALAGFYEPFLARTEMARWEAGTRTLAGVPAIALVGYPSFAVLSLLAGGFVLRRWQGRGARLAALAVATPLAAAGHAWALDRLKAGLGW